MLPLCLENPSQDPSPFHPFPSSLSPGEREEGEGSRGDGSFSWFPGARRPTGMSDSHGTLPGRKRCPDAVFHLHAETVVGTCTANPTGCLGALIRVLQ